MQTFFKQEAIIDQTAPRQKLVDASFAQARQGSSLCARQLIQQAAGLPLGMLAPTHLRHAPRRRHLMIPRFDRSIALLIKSLGYWSPAFADDDTGGCG